MEYWKTGETRKSSVFTKNNTRSIIFLATADLRAAYFCELFVKNDIYSNNCWNPVMLYNSSKLFGFDPLNYFREYHDTDDEDWLCDVCGHDVTECFCDDDDDFDDE